MKKNNQLILLLSLRGWRLWLLITAVSVTGAVLIVSLMSLLLKGEVTWDYVLTGIVTVSIVAPPSLGLLGYLLDVIADRNAAIAIQESHNLLQSIISTAPIRVFWKDRESRYLGCNPAFARDAGKASPAELIGLDDFAMVWANQAELYRADDLEVMTSDLPRLHYEERRSTADGKTIWARISKVPLRGASGEVIGMLGIYDDISERKLTEARLERQVSYNEMMRRMSVSLINLPLAQLDQAINMALAQVGSFFSADRAYVFEYDLDAGTTSNTFEWCAPGIDPQIDELQQFPIHTIPGWFETHQRGEALLIPSVETLPPGTLRATLERQDIRSLLAVPVMHGSVCQGFVGLDAVRQTTEFGIAEVELLDLFAELLANLNERKQSEATATQQAREMELHNRILKSINQGMSLHDVLDELVRLVEEQNPGCTCSILLLDEDGQHLRHGAAPSLPDFYNQAIDGLKIGEGVGACGTAAYRGERMIVEDIHTHPFWAPFRKLANQAGLAACWSQPFKSRDNRVLGTFAIYHRDPATPIDDEIARIDDYARLASLAVTHHQAEEKLRRAANVFTYAREGIMITDREANIVEVNHAFTTITGYSREEVLGKNPRMLSSGRQDRAFYVALWHDLQTKDSWSGELWNQHKDGHLFAEMLTISVIRDEQGDITNCIGLFSDITAVKEYQSQLEHIAHYDALTGQPNRLLLADRLQQAMLQANRRGQSLAVTYLDLDGFKTVNDTHGHQIGDQLLIALAKRMSEALREGDTLARMGGDEFVAILVDLPDTESSTPILNRLLEAAAQPMQVGEFTLQVSASVGVSFHPQEDEIDADQLIRQADQAMYQAKQSGKNRYHIFDAEHDRSVRGRHESLEQIKQALESREFVLFYQPKVNMRSGEILGVEALIRWQHPRRGLLSPAVFLPVIENHSLIIELGEWVIDKALSQIEIWHSEGMTIPVSVNVSALQLQHPNFVARLRALLARHPGVQPGELELEVLETSALEDFAAVSQVMQACKEIGLTFAVDDFGTGYSSLAYLKQLPATVLKIDQSFVRDMLDDPDDLAILEGVMGLATAFRRHVIAEGVETPAHGELLLRMGCAWGQGYAIARPMPAEELPRWLAGWQTPAAWQAIKPVSRERLPVLFAAVDHRAWINAMAAYLSGMRNTPPELNDRHCRFGDWLNSSRGVLFSNSIDHPLETLHREVHRLGAELVALKQAGHSDTTQARLPELLQLRDQLLLQLSELY